MHPAARPRCAASHSPGSRGPARGWYKCTSAPRFGGWRPPPHAPPSPNLRQAGGSHRSSSRRFVRMQPVRLPPFTPAPNILRLASQAAAAQNRLRPPTCVWENNEGRIAAQLQGYSLHRACRCLHQHGPGTCGRGLMVWTRRAEQLGVSLCRISLYIPLLACMQLCKSSGHH